MRNVGIVFSPTLGIPAGVFSLMLGEFNRVFNVSGEGSDSSVDDEEAPPTARKRVSDGLSRRNSQRYSDAAADQLLGLAGRTLPGESHSSVALCIPPSHSVYYSVTEEDRSDEGEDPVDDEESDEENTENEDPSAPSADSSHSYHNHPPQIRREGSPALHVDPPSDDASHTHTHDPNATPPAKSRASVVASSRGLNLNLSGSGSKTDRRRSRLPGGAGPGLPPSPRPMGQVREQAQAQSPLSTPTFGSQTSR